MVVGVRQVSFKIFETADLLGFFIQSIEFRKNSQKNFIKKKERKSSEL